MWQRRQQPFVARSDNNAEERTAAKRRRYARADGPELGLFCLLDPGKKATCPVQEGRSSEMPEVWRRRYRGRASLINNSLVTSTAPVRDAGVAEVLKDGSAALAR